VHLNLVAGVRAAPQCDDRATILAWPGPGDRAISLVRRTMAIRCTSS